MQISKEDVLQTAFNLIEEEYCLYYDIPDDKPMSDVVKDTAEIIGCIYGICTFARRILKKGDNDD